MTPPDSPPPPDPADSPHESAFFRAGAPPPGSPPPPAGSAQEDEAATAAMFYRMSAERLRARCLWAGVALALTVLVPYEVIGGQGLFVWSVLPELPLAARIAALAPAAGGLFLLLLALRAKGGGGLVLARPTTRAIAVLAGFAAVNGALWIGRRSSAWGLLPLPDSLTTRPAPFLLVFALTAAGAVARFHPRSRRAGRAFLLGSLAAALVFYLWPSRAEVPAQTIARAVVSVATLEDVRFQIGYGLLLLFVLGPMVVALLGLAYVRAVPSREHPGVAIAAVWGVPGLMLLFVYRAFIGGGAGAQTMVTAFSALLLVAVVSVLAAALEVLALGLSVPAAAPPAAAETHSAHPASPPLGAAAAAEQQASLQPASPGAPPPRSLDAEAWGGLRPAVAAGAAGALVAALLGVMLLLGRPAPKGVDWQLAAPTPGWDHVLGELLPGWERARLARDEHARSELGTGAQAQVATKSRARALLAAARDQPGGEDFTAAMETLVSEVDDLELSGRAFGRLVAGVNDAARRADLPYYLDPSVSIRLSEQGQNRLFQVTPYRVREVHGYLVGGDRYATLIVEPMTPGARVHLGFSRDQDPFALVLRSEIESYSERIARDGAPCHEGVSDPGRAAPLARCDAALASLRARPGVDLKQAAFLSTERHELQHQIDGPHLPLSRAVAELLAGFTDEAQDRANRELSAYVAEMTTPGVPPQLTLVHLFPFGVLSRAGAEHRVAVLLLETLSGRRLRFGARAVDPGTFASAFEEQFRRPDDDLRAAARAAWREHFGADLPEPVRQ